MSDLFDYKKEMSALRFTGEQKETLAKAAAEAAREQTARKRRPVFRAGLIAAVVAAVLVVGSSAAGVLPEPVDVFAPLFGGAVAQTEVIDKIGHPIGAGASDGGITISADAIMGDEYNAVIVYTLSRDDGERFLPEGIEARHLLMGGFGGASWVKGGSHGGSWFVDADRSDNKIQMIETASSDVSMTKGTATARFEDLCYWNSETEEPEPLYPGNWKFRFEVDYEDCAVHLDGGDTFSQDNLTFTIDGISISPIAVKVDYTVDKEAVWSNAESGRVDPKDGPQMQRYLENVEVLLTKTDGTVVDMGNSGGSVHSEEGLSVCTKSRVFDEIIPLEDMAFISAGGVVYEIPHD